MKRMLIFMMALCCAIASWTQDYKSLDAKQPIEFKGDRIVYNNQEIVLGPKAFFIDGQLSYLPRMSAHPNGHFLFHCASGWSSMRGV